MAKFVFIYRGTEGYRPNPERAAAWLSWFEGLGSQVVQMGQPVAAQEILGNCSSETTVLAGYSIIEAADAACARALAQGCPHLDSGGGVEIGQLAEIPAVVRQA